MGRQRTREAIKDAAPDAWAGTHHLMLRLARDSIRVSAWRPARAAAMIVAQDSVARVWMTPDEFRSWRARTTKMLFERAVWDRGKTDEFLGISSRTADAYQLGESPVPKAIALACAHIALGMELPIPAGDSKRFAAYLDRRFVSMLDVGRWLDLDHRSLNDRARGWYLRKGSDRTPIAPEPFLIRALDWMDRCGPFCPYGQPTRREAWAEPIQPKED